MGVIGRAGQRQRERGRSESEKERDQREGIGGRWRGDV